MSINMESSNQAKNPVLTNGENISQWFDNVIDDIKTDKLTMECNVATPEKAGMYDVLFRNDPYEVAKIMQGYSVNFFTRAIVGDFLKKVVENKGCPSKLAFAFNGTRISFWAEIKEGDEETEDALIMAEARVNAQFESYNTSVSMTIIDDSDKVKTPPHYILIPIEKFKL